MYYIVRVDHIVPYCEVAKELHCTSYFVTSEPELVIKLFTTGDSSNRKPKRIVTTPIKTVKVEYISSLDANTQNFYVELPGKQLVGDLNHYLKYYLKECNQVHPGVVNVKPVCMATTEDLSRDYTALLFIM